MDISNWQILDWWLTSQYQISSGNWNPALCNPNRSLNSFLLGQHLTSLIILKAAIKSHLVVVVLHSKTLSNLVTVNQWSCECLIVLQMQNDEPSAAKPSDFKTVQKQHLGLWTTDLKHCSKLCRLDSQARGWALQTLINQNPNQLHCRGLTCWGLSGEGRSMSRPGESSSKIIPVSMIAGFWAQWSGFWAQWWSAVLAETARPYYHPYTLERGHVQHC